MRSALSLLFQNHDDNWLIRMIARTVRVFFISCLGLFFLPLLTVCDSTASAETTVVANANSVTDAKSADEIPLLLDGHARFRIELPVTILSDVPVAFVKIIALDRHGQIDDTFHKQRPLIIGIEVFDRHPETGRKKAIAIPAFQKGVLELKTDLRHGRKVYLTGKPISVTDGSLKQTIVKMETETVLINLTGEKAPKRGRVYFTGEANKETADGEKVDGEDEEDEQQEQIVLITNRWFSIVPPLLAIILSVWFRNVLLAMFVAIWGGAVILHNGYFLSDFCRTWQLYLLIGAVLVAGFSIWKRQTAAGKMAGKIAFISGTIAVFSTLDILSGLSQSLDGYLINEIADPDGGHTHLLIMLFTIFLGAMIGVMSASGGTQAIVDRLSRFTKSREHGQVMTWLMGFVIFFDDYANTLLVGSTMRPITDRLKISREKLAFLVDSTAAPVAGLALISTWVGFEVGQIQDTYERLFADSSVEWNAYSIFLSTISYRFYPVHLLGFVLLVAYIGHDYGPMLKAERRAFEEGRVSRLEPPIDAEENVEGNSAADSVEKSDDENDDRDDKNSDKDDDKKETDEDADDSPPEIESGLSESPKPLLRNALLPLVTLIGLVLFGLWWTGHEAYLAKAPAWKAEHPETLRTILNGASSNRVMFLASFVASVAALSITVFSRSLTLTKATEAWISGAKSMFFATIILVLAWAIARLCDSHHLDTAGFLVELADGQISASWIPALAFVLSAVVAFATGSSFTTMGLLIPLFITMTYYLLVGDNDLDPNHPLMLSSIGAVLAGAIFGDHCSPISDTTVLSSAATGCDHLDHVATQFPYAMTVAVISLLFGYIPVGFGYSPLILMPIGLMVMFCVVQFWGKPVTG